MENWKVIDEYPSYLVSDIGRVKSIRHNKGYTSEKILKTAVNTYGYLQVGLYKEGKIKTQTVHSLVAKTFLMKEDPSYEVDHINRNRQDNRKENLRWVSRSINHSNRIFKSKLKEHHIQENQGLFYVRYFKDGSYIIYESFKSLKEAIVYRDNLNLPLLDVGIPERLFKVR